MRDRQILSAEDAQLRLARKTIWREESPDLFSGLGQRVIATDSGEHPLMDVRTIELGVSAGASQGEPGA